MAAALDRLGSANPQDVGYRVEADKQRGGFRVVLTRETPEDFPGARGVWFSGSSRLRMDGRRRWVHTAVWAQFQTADQAREALHAMRMRLDAQYAADHEAAAQRAKEEAAYQARVADYQAPRKALRVELLAALDACEVSYEADPDDDLGSVRVNGMLWCPLAGYWFPSPPPEAAKLPEKFRAGRNS